MGASLATKTWTSGWFCGKADRTPLCYFNFTRCRLPDVPDETITAARSQGKKASRNDARAIEMRGWSDEFGTAWVSGQLTYFLFRHATHQLRLELERRRQPIFGAWGGNGEMVIGLHIRRGDSCVLRSRFCPANLTSAYFMAAARMRAVYGANKLFVATDNAEAANLCRSSVLGFDCRTMFMDRRRFESTTSIVSRRMGERRLLRRRRA